ncbi:molybdate ABC transporter permease subunit [Arthrobacter sp. MYb211]|uniref:ABC transporter permease n=1 Tax=unclassified Arthrobacter TaxID=235627 RepID=UPI000CFBBEE9|nr:MULTISPECIES: ABC transporter permease [unclassified Arthrobacter]PQZ98659.1 molybdate ABC transporter permease subunit [Arthrobacter sp. MYb224]PRA11044.1 molybdate ABC transporter permease subunit [Arthrobacter sp. MYb221]PRC07199.1 molybdate ABC transporter permease subunit [Arthrobacter sp. MYb211]
MTAQVDVGTRAPSLVLLPAVLAVALLVLPLMALLTQASWSTLWADVTSPQALQALGLSLRTGLLATVLCTLLGVPLALLIARSSPHVAQVLRALVAVPLVLPPMVGGVALLLLFGRTSGIGQLLEQLWGFTLPFSTAAVVMAQMFVGLPFLVLTVEGTLRTSGAAYEQTAATLGAGRWMVLTRISLPLAAPGLLAGMILCFARALGEFGATALFAGNAPGRTQTMPLAIYTAFNGAGAGRESAVALSLLLLAAAVLVLVCLRAWRPGALK